jgi:predicted permease
LLLLASVGILLLIGCADIANLMFSRMVARQREFAVRAALGAGIWRLARQTITEGLILSLIGGVLGFGITFLALPLLLHFAPDNLPRLSEVGVNWRITIFVVAITLTTPILFCLAPLVNTTRFASANQFQGEGRTTTQSRHRRLLMSGAVVVQFSLACVLLTAAGLLVRSFLKATESDPGFRPQHIISVRIALPDAIYSQPVQATSFFNRLLTRLNKLPGVQQTGAASDLPMGSTAYRNLSVEGRATKSEKVDTIFCLGDALGLLRLTLVRGRLLQPSDELAKQRVAIISESLAKRIWGGEDPLGRHVKFGFDPKEPWITVVGVVKDIKDRLTNDSPRSVVFTTREDWVNDMDVLVRSSVDPRSLANAIRHEVNQVDPNLAVGQIETVGQILDESLSAERFRSLLLASFAIAALLLSMLGIAGLLAYDTVQRAREFGVRFALGADRGDLLLLVFKRCLRLSGTGITVGLLASILATGELSTLLYDTSPHDLGTFIAVPAILTLVALAASLFPAWRAAHTDRLIALRAE